MKKQRDNEDVVIPPEAINILDAIKHSELGLVTSRTTHIYTVVYLTESKNQFMVSEMIQQFDRGERIRPVNSEIKKRLFQF